MSGHNWVKLTSEPYYEKVYESSQHSLCHKLLFLLIWLHVIRSDHSCKPLSLQGDLPTFYMGMVLYLRIATRKLVWPGDMEAESFVVVVLNIKWRKEHLTWTRASSDLDRSIIRPGQKHLLTWTRASSDQNESITLSCRQQWVVYRNWQYIRHTSKILVSYSFYQHGTFLNRTVALEHF